MKKFILGFISAVITIILIPSTTSLVTYYSPPENGSKWEDLAIDLKYSTYIELNIFKTFTHSCTKDIRRNGHGWVFVSRDYFECNKLEILISDLIYGEKTFRSEEDKADQICDKCTM